MITSMKNLQFRDKKKNTIKVEIKDHTVKSIKLPSVLRQNKFTDNAQQTINCK